MQLCGVQVSSTELALLGSLAYSVASEAIGQSKLKDNTVIGFAMTIVGRFVHKADTPQRSTPRPSAKSQGQRRSATRRSPSKSTSRISPE